VDTPLFRHAIYRGATCEENLARIRALGFPVLPAATAARHILGGVRRGRRSFAFPLHAKMIAWLAPRCPAAVAPIHRMVLSQFRGGAGPSVRPRRPGPPATAFAGRTALVTGAASGIGRALVAGLLAHGARVHAIDIDAPALESLAAAHPGAALTNHVLDVTDWDAVGRGVAAAIEADEAIDYLFNNAGVTLLGEAHKVPFDRWRWLLDVNVAGVIAGTAHVYPHMVRRGGGHIVNTASIAGVTGYPTAAAYTMSKAAVLELTRSLRAEARTFGVRVSAACPGYVDTGIFTQDRTVGAQLATVIRDLPASMMSPEAAAAAILDGVARGRHPIVFPLGARLLWHAAKWVPALIRPLHQRLLATFR
jgi:NADP-dependent 3-hydroxy acid dehydrogenase YdfG